MPAYPLHMVSPPSSLKNKPSDNQNRSIPQEMWDEVWCKPEEDTCMEAELQAMVNGPHDGTCSHAKASILYRSTERGCVPFRFKWKFNEKPGIEWIPVPGAIYAVRQFHKNGKVRWLAKFFANITLQQDAEFTVDYLEHDVSDAFLKWLLTRRSYTMIVKAAKDRWKRVKPEFYQSYVDSLCFYKVRPRGLFSIEMLSTKNLVVVFDECDNFLETAKPVNPGQRFPKNLLQTIERQREARNPNWIDIHAGAACKRNAEAVKDTKTGTTTNKEEGYMYAHPEIDILFTQDSSDPEDYFCMMKALCSAVARVPELSEMAPALQEALGNIDCDVGSYLHNFNQTVETVLQHQPVKYTSSEAFDLLNCRHELPVWAILDCDQHIHCVAVYGGKLYDPAEKSVLELSRHNLDLICGGVGKWKGVRTAYHLKKMDNKRHLIDPIHVIRHAANGWPTQRCCFNCGKTDHTVGNCLQPRDPAKIKIARELKATEKRRASNLMKKAKKKAKKAKMLPTPTA